jgi:hypothetical protein
LLHQVKYYLERVVRQLEILAKEVPSLQRLAAWRVWLLVGKRFDRVRNLPVKVELKTAILPLLPKISTPLYLPMHTPYT